MLNIFQKIRSTYDDNPTQWFNAAANNNVRKLEELLPVIGDINLLDAKNIDTMKLTALTWAAWNGKQLAVEYLINHGAKANGTELQKATEQGHTAIVYLLTSAFRYTAMNLNSALYAASMQNHIEIIRRLLNVGADIHDNNDRALMAACENLHHESAKLLLLRGANIHARDNIADVAGYNVFEKVISVICHKPVVQIENESVKNDTFEDETIKLLRLLLDANADIRSVTGNDLDDIHRHGFYKISEFLSTQKFNFINNHMPDSECRPFQIRR